MSGRSESYNEFIAEKMRDPEYAREQVKISIELRDSISDGLRVAIRAMGIKEFSEKSGELLQNVVDGVRTPVGWQHRLTPLYFCK